MLKLPLDKDFYGEPVPDRPVVWLMGDSHTCYLEEMEATDGYYLAYRHPDNGVLNDWPPTIWQLTEKNSTSKGRRHLLRALRNIRENDVLTLVYGEVDARVHIPKRFLGKKASLETCVSETVERYGRVLSEIRDMGMSGRIIVHGIIPMGTLVFIGTTDNTIHLYDKPEYTYFDVNKFGSKTIEMIAEEYYQLNECLKTYCDTNGYNFFDIMPFVSKSRGIADPKWLLDEIHLKTSASVFFEKWLLDKVNV